MADFGYYPDGMYYVLPVILSVLEKHGITDEIWTDDTVQRIVRTMLKKLLTIVPVPPYPYDRINDERFLRDVYW